MKEEQDDSHAAWGLRCGVVKYVRGERGAGDYEHIITYIHIKYLLYISSKK